MSAAPAGPGRPSAGFGPGALGLVGGLLWHNSQLQEAAQREHDQAEQARSERRWVRQAADDLYTQVAEKWLARQSRLEPVQRQFLEKALTFYQHLAEQGDADPSLRLETARAYIRLGGIQHVLGKPAEALASYHKATALFEKLLAESPDESAYSNGLANSHGGAGKALQAAGRAKEAAREYEMCIAWRRKQVAAFPQRLDYQRGLGSVLGDLGMVLGAVGKVREAERAFGEGQDTLRRVVKAAPANREYRNTLAVHQGNLGNLFANTGRDKQAEPIYREAIATLQKLAEEDPTEPNYRETWAYLLTVLS
jgi:tetratricopeptide (TPR) repeat protein